MTTVRERKAVSQLGTPNILEDDSICSCKLEYIQSALRLDHISFDVSGGMSCDSCVGLIC